MTCDEYRDKLLAWEGIEPPPPVRAHLESCTSCAAFARRFETAREALRDHRAEHQPDPYFARRVSALAAGGSDPLGWAAMKLLPVTLTLVLAMSAWCWLATPGPSELFEQAPTEDLLGWALEESGS